MTASDHFTTPGDSEVLVVGPAEFLTEERMEAIGQRFDADPRIATISVASGDTGTFLRAVAPGGAVVCVRVSHEALVGPFAEPDLESWALAASNRGLAHEWLLAIAEDLADTHVRPTALMDASSQQRATSAHFAVATASRSNSLSLAVDASWLGEHETGAQVLTTSAVNALADNPSVTAISLRGLDELPDYARHLADHPKVSVGGSEQADVCWFPNQIDFRSNVALARNWGKRIVTTYLDLIAYDIPRYHASHAAWDAYRSLQRTMALASDGITTISADVATRLQQEVPLLEETRIRAIPLGLDHIRVDQVPEHIPEEIRSIAPDLSERVFVLVLGNDFLHKNRDFAIAVWQDVLRSGVPCDLVLAGLHVRGSSSRSEEERFMATHVDLRGRVHTLDHVSSATRAWLLSHASAVLYPSSAEGFGFVPYEAAALGTPSTFTMFGPLAELTGVSDAPRSWDRVAYATDLTALLTDPVAAQRRISTLQRAIAQRSWRNFAQELIDFMFHISSMPISAGGAVLSEAARDSIELNAVLASKTWRATAPLRKMGKVLRGRDTS